MISKFLKYGCMAVVALSVVSYAAKVMPVLVTTKYTLTMGPMTFEATAKNGGRIQSVKHTNLQVLHQDTNSATQYGSTFWPSPQAVWNWPPPANLDGTGAYTASIGTDSTINLVGSVDNTTKLRIRKMYWADTRDSSFNMRYTLVNTGTGRQWSPWEDSRIDTGGIYLFPKGTTAATGQLASRTRDSIGMTWYRHNAAGVLGSGTNKFYADGSQGWFAHVYANRLIFIKKFSDSPAAKKAPSPEDEIELYATNSPLGNSSFVEMENQGSYDMINTGDSTSWDVKWYVRRLPDTMAVEIGNQAIVNFITAVLATAPTSLQHPAYSKAFPMNYIKNRVSLVMDKTSNVSLSMVNARGREVARIHSGPLSQGAHEFAVDASLPKGIYWLMLKGSDRRILSAKEVVRL